MSFFPLIYYGGLEFLSPFFLVTVGPVFSQNANSQYASNLVFAMDAKAHKGFQ
jgi:hypothetical protein